MISNCSLWKSILISVHLCAVRILSWMSADKIKRSKNQRNIVKVMTSHYVQSCRGDYSSLDFQACREYSSTDSSKTEYTVSAVLGKFFSFFVETAPIYYSVVICSFPNRDFGLAIRPKNYLKSISRLCSSFPVAPPRTAPSVAASSHCLSLASYGLRTAPSVTSKVASDVSWSHSLCWSTRYLAKLTTATNTFSFRSRSPYRAASCQPGSCSAPSAY